MPHFTSLIVSVIVASVYNNSITGLVRVPRHPNGLWRKNVTVFLDHNQSVAATFFGGFPNSSQYEIWQFSYTFAYDQESNLDLGQPAALWVAVTYLDNDVTLYGNLSNLPFNNYVVSAASPFSDSILLPVVLATYKVVPVNVAVPTPNMGDNYAMTCFAQASYIKDTDAATACVATYTSTLVGQTSESFTIDLTKTMTIHASSCEIWQGATTSEASASIIPTQAQVTFEDSQGITQTRTTSV